MTAYLIRRIGTSIVILIGISIFVFILLHSVFPSPAIVILGPKATPKAVAAWNAEMTLPILCIALLVLAGYSRYMRSSAMETLAQDYIKTARAKGLPERLVLFRHLARNACLPAITLVGLSIPALLAGNPHRRVRLQLRWPGPAVLQQPRERGLSGADRVHARRRAADRARQPAGRHRADHRRPADTAELTASRPGAGWAAPASGGRAHGRDHQGDRGRDL